LAERSEDGADLEAIRDRAGESATSWSVVRKKVGAERDPRMIE
jgi:hypothetical protein